MMELVFSAAVLYVVCWFLLRYVLPKPRIRLTRGQRINLVAARERHEKMHQEMRRLSEES